MQGFLHSLKLQETGGVTKPMVYYPQTQDYGLLPRTLLNSVTDDFMRVFWKGCTKTKLENIQKKFCCGVPVNTNVQIQSAAYIELKTPLQINFEKCSERKRCSKSSKIQKKYLQFCTFFSNLIGLQSTISDISKYRLQEKCFLWVFWNSWKFTRKRSTMKSFD